MHCQSRQTSTMFKFTSTLIILLGIALSAQPAHSRVRGRSRSSRSSLSSRSNRSSRGSRSMSHAARTTSHMRSSRRRTNGPYAIGVMQVQAYVNDTCTIRRATLLSNSDIRYKFTQLPYCVNQMQKDCQVCNGELYYSRFRSKINCCDGKVDRNGNCYAKHLRDVTGNLCYEKYHKLNSTGHCYLAYPKMHYFDTVYKISKYGFVTIFMLGSFILCNVAFEIICILWRRRQLNMQQQN